MANEIYIFEAEIGHAIDTQSPKSAFHFALVPKHISDKFARRGRTSANVKVNDYSFDTLLEPDGNLSHWVKIDGETANKANLAKFSQASFAIKVLDNEIEPIVPNDLQNALGANPIAQMGWDKTTTIARIDWVHWIESAKQEKTRTKRISDAINMLIEGKLRVCCFDNSGFYSKAIKAPISTMDVRKH